MTSTAKYKEITPIAHFAENEPDIREIMYFEMDQEEPEETNDDRMRRETEKVNQEAMRLIESFGSCDVKDRVVKLEMLLGSWIETLKYHELAYPFPSEMIHAILSNCALDDDYMPFVVFRFIDESLKRYPESTRLFVDAGIVPFLKACLSESRLPELMWRILNVFSLLFVNDPELLAGMVENDFDTIMHVVQAMFRYEQISAPVITISEAAGEDSAVWTIGREQYVKAELPCLVQILSVVTFPTEEAVMMCCNCLKKMENDFALVPEVIANVNDCFSKLAQRHRPELISSVMMDNNYYETLFDHLFTLRNGCYDCSWFTVCTCRLLPLLQCLIQFDPSFYERFLNCGLFDMLMVSLKDAADFEGARRSASITSRDVLNILDIVILILALIDDGKIVEHGSIKFQNIIIEGLKRLREESSVIRQRLLIAFAALVPQSSEAMKGRIMYEFNLLPDLLDLADIISDKESVYVVIRGIRELIDFGTKADPISLTKTLSNVDPATFLSDMEEEISDNADAIASLQHIRQIMHEAAEHS